MRKLCIELDCKPREEGPEYIHLNFCDNLPDKPKYSLDMVTSRIKRLMEASSQNPIESYLNCKDNFETFIKTFNMQFHIIRGGNIFSYLGKGNICSDEFFRTIEMMTSKLVSNGVLEFVVPNGKYICSYMAKVDGDNSWTWNKMRYVTNMIGPCGHLWTENSIKYFFKEFVALDVEVIAKDTTPLMTVKWVNTNG